MYQVNNSVTFRGKPIKPIGSEEFLSQMLETSSIIMVVRIGLKINDIISKVSLSIL